MWDQGTGNKILSHEMCQNGFRSSTIFSPGPRVQDPFNFEGSKVLSVAEKSCDVSLHSCSYVMSIGHCWHGRELRFHAAQEGHAGVHGQPAEAGIGQVSQAGHE